MLNVDIFVKPELLYSPTSRYFWDIHWFPVRLFRKKIKQAGINIRFKTLRSFSYDKMADIVCFSSSYFYKFKRSLPMKYPIPLECFEELKKREKKIIWFDMQDGAGSTNFQVLDFVDKYYKNQLLKDMSLYKKPRNRAHHTDFYSREYNLKKPEALDSQIFYPLKNQHEKKIALSWNYALYDFRYFGRTKLAFGFSKLFDQKINLKFKTPRKFNKYILSARFTPRNFQRRELLKFLKKSFSTNKIRMGFIPRNLYIKELQNTDAILSPFGYGEPCFRDIEAFIAGAALIKPNMDHIKTWPDIYRDQETYIAFPWEIEKWKDTIPKILDDGKLLHEIAKEGQNVYKKIWEKKEILEFVNHFKSLILDC